MGSVMLSSSSELMVFHRLLRPAPIPSFSFLKQSLSLPHQTTSLHPITNTTSPSFFPSFHNHSSIFLRSRTFSNHPVNCGSQALLESPEDVDDEEIAKENGELKIHGSCPGGELDDVVKHLEEATGSVAIGQIGRTVILYRPSVTKLKAEEKKKQAQNAFMRKKQYAAKQSFESKGQVPRPYARGRRGSSRV
ncbi:hypothetical protein A4A49_40991 [Nicotiana attenuata]|uniref:CRM domain-containing protein n=1 Tax=Nicotiana attenuata TaxID=49451 RepID=A0A1J6J317_NICAT|nr:hypothetical protein A4A49_40991 [Nicotiana attenuata]